MSSGEPIITPVPIDRTAKLGAGVVLFVLLTLAIGWTALGAVFYQRAAPFYDSLAYQQSYIATARASAGNGVWATVAAEWRSPGGTTVLFRLFGATFGGVGVDSREGLYLYLNLIHLAGMIALVGVVWRASVSRFLAGWALAAWLAAGPFTQAVSGVLDQRMDLASGSFCLLTAALAFDWSRTRTRWGALLVGLAAALAILHRPVMIGTVAAILGLFAVRAWWRERATAGFWLRQLAALAVPVAVLALPWLVAHRTQLYQYYVVANVDVGNAGSWREASIYNLGAFAGHFGGNYAWLLLAGGVWAGVFRRIDWLDVGVVVLATAVPLLLLIVSRSVGNFLVCQVALGLPALLLACVRPEGRSGRENPAWMPLACAVLLWSEYHGFAALRYQVATRSTEVRVQSLQAVGEIAGLDGGGRKVIAGVQTAPLDPFAFCVIAQESGFDFAVGSRLFHPGDFGLSNAAARDISDQDMQVAAARALQGLKGRDTLLMLPEADAVLPDVPFSQRKLKSIRAAVAADPAFKHRLTTRPISGVRFDIYSIGAP